MKVLLTKIPSRTHTSNSLIRSTLFSCSSQPSFIGLRRFSSDNKHQEPQSPVQAETPKKKQHTIDSRVWPIALSTLAGGTSVGVIFPVLPIFAKDLGLSSQDFGLVISIVGLTRLLLNVPAAWLTDRYGRRFTLLGGPALSALGMSLTATSQSLFELVSYRFITGMGGSLQMTGAQMYLADISTPENRARTMAPMGIAFATGATIGPGLGGYLSEHFGYRVPFIFVSSAIAVIAMINYKLLPETRKKIPSLEERSNKKLKDEFKSVIQQWRPLLQNKDMRSVLLLHLTYWCVASGCTWTLLPILATDKLQLSASELGGLFAFMSAISIIGLGPSAWVSDKFGRKATILPAAMIGATALSVMPYAGTHEALFGLVGAWAVGATLFQSNPSAFVSDMTTEETRGQALALLRSAGDAGLFFGAGGFGALSYATSPTFAFSFASVALLAAATNFVRPFSRLQNVSK